MESGELPKISENQERKKIKSDYYANDLRGHVSAKKGKK